MERLKKLPLSWTATIALLLATLIIAVFATAYKLPQMLKYEKDLAGRSTADRNTEFLSKSLITAEDEVPYLKTDIDGLYYTANFNGEIDFYRFNGKEFKRVRTSDTIKVKLPETKKEVNIYFAKFNSETVGIGVYSDKKDKEFPYAFIKVINNDITENYDYIAFVDKSIADYYKHDKVYEGAFAFSKKNSEVEQIFDFDENSAYIPVNLITERKDGFYFFKKNTDKDGYGLYLQTTISGKEVTISENIILPYAFCKDGNLLLLEYADTYRDTLKLAGDTSFILSQVTGIKTDFAKEFNRDPSEYIVKGNYIFNPIEKTLYDVLADTEQTINADISLSGIEDFTLSEGAAKIALTGSMGTENDKLFFYEFATDRINLVGGNDIFLPGNSNITFLGEDNIFFLSPGSNSNYVKNIIIPWEDLF